MIVEVNNTEFIDRFLALPENDTFCSEIGRPMKMPPSLKYLYEDGCMMILEEIDGGFGIHLACEKGRRGGAAVRFSKRVFGLLREDCNGCRILARIQRHRKDVMLIARLAGMVEYGVRDTHVYFEVKKCH